MNDFLKLVSDLLEDNKEEIKNLPVWVRFACFCSITDKLALSDPATIKKFAQDYLKLLSVNDK